MPAMTMNVQKGQGVAMKFQSRRPITTIAAIPPTSWSIPSLCICIFLSFLILFPMTMILSIKDEVFNIILMQR